MPDTVSLFLSLEHFLKNSETPVAMLSGAWGVGKTYLWTEQFLPKRKKLIQECGMTHYSYVSIFNCADVYDFQRQLIVNRNPIKSSTKTGGWRHWVADAASSVDEIPIPGVGNFKVPERLAHTALMSLLSNTLVVVDDLERKPASFQMDNLLGHLSMLKEQMKCKILIIFNEEKVVKEEDRVSLNMYREKIVDYEFKYLPTVDSRIALIFSEEESDAAQAIAVLKLMSIGNIRIIRKVRANMQLLGAMLGKSWKNLQPSVRAMVVRQLAYITVFHNDATKGIPVSKLSDYSQMRRLSGLWGDKEKENDEYGLRTYGYYYNSEMDPYLISLVTAAVCDVKALSSYLQELDRRERSNHVREEYLQMWSAFTSNFTTSTEEVVGRVKEFSKKHFDHLAWNELLEIVNFLKEMEVDAPFQDWIDRHIVQRSKDSNLVTLKSFERFAHSEEAKEAIREGVKINSNLGKIPDLIQDIVQKQGWHHETFEFLNTKSEDDYYNWIISDQSDEHITFLQAFLRMFRNPSGPNEMAVRDKIYEALGRVARLSKVNRKRVVTLIFGDQIPPAFKEMLKEVSDQ